MDSRTNEKASIQVAAKALGVSAKTIQRWVKSGKIQSIREDNRVFIPVDEIRTRLQEQRAGVADIDQDKKEDVQTIRGHDEAKSIDVIPITRTHYEGLLTRLGQLEANQQLLLEYRAGIESRDKALEQAKGNISAQAQEIATVKSALATNTTELEEARSTITKARSELQRLLEIKQDAEQKAKVVLEQQAELKAKEHELEALKMEVERLRRPWWKRIFQR
jgi:excisionase family DNA binding protein